MANYTSTEYKQFGPNLLTTDADRMALVKNPVKADTFAAFQAKIIAEVAIDNTDVSFAAVGADLEVTIAGQNALDATGTALLTDDLAVAIYDTTSEKVHLVQDATNRVVNDTDPVNIPDLVMYIREATPVV